MLGKGDTALPDMNDLINTGIGRGKKGENSNLQKDLANRVQYLRETMYSLKEQLKDEKDLWRREIDKVCKLQYEENIGKNTSSEITELSSSGPVNTCGTYDRKMPIETAVTVYEKHLQRCHDSGFLGLQSDYHQDMRRQLAAHSYKRKLMEVERMCNNELARMKQTASYLEPLNKIASEWNLPRNEALNNQRFISAGDLHYAKSNNISHSSGGPENHFQLSSTSSDLPPTSSLEHLSLSGCEREHTMNINSGYVTSPAMIPDQEISLELAELHNRFCECEDLPLMVHNKLWPN